jgi:hypothetical protein
MANKLTPKQERASRIIARGEVSGHSHIVVGNAKVRRNKDGELLIDVEAGGATIKHLIEKEYVENDKLVWTNEHFDIELAPGEYLFLQETEWDAYAETIRIVED